MREIIESAEIDQFALPIAQAWVEGALERGFIAKTDGLERVGSLQHHRRGGNAARVSTGRFVSDRPAMASRPAGPEQTQ